MKTAIQTDEHAKAIDLRNELKALLAREIAALPELIDKLEGKERIDAILKLLPLVVPKAEPSPYLVAEGSNWRLNKDCRDG